MSLYIDSLHCRYGKREVLRDIRLDIPPGVTAIIGPNGAGKSTLVKCIAGAIDYRGEVHFDGLAARGATRNEYARRVSYLPQSGLGGGAFTVFEAVLLGMLDSLSLRVDEETQSRVARTLARLGIAALSSRRLDELSGGQSQLVAIAQALVKEPRLLLLDELLNNLDIHHQFELLKLMTTLTRERGLTTVIVVHDLNMAAKFAERVIAIADGRVTAQGLVAQVLTSEGIRSLYHVHALTCGTPDQPCFNLIDTVAPTLREDAPVQHA